MIQPLNLSGLEMFLLLLVVALVVGNLDLIFRPKK